MISMIAAVGKNLEIGKDNKLIWHFPRDMKFFRKTTEGHTVIMGRKTFESLGKPLKNRHHIVLTTKESWHHENAETMCFVDDAILIYGSLDKEENFVIGGGEIYEQFLPYANKLYLTEIDASADADVFFPNFDKSKWIRKVLDSFVDEKSGISVEIAEYTRKDLQK
ncbi:MAG: dihydrofolate reductase [Ruminococcaceae bacterium]|nr:dihydrofolate reductase [Oscillospiraceae bacterium]